MDNASQIINNVLNYLQVKAPTFAKEIDVIYQRIYDIQKGKTKAIPKDIADKACAKYPELNKYYLLTGEGDILLSTTTQYIPDISYDNDDIETRFASSVQYLMDNRMLRSQAELSSILDVTKGYTSLLVNAKTKPSSQVLEKFINNFPNINKNWLLTGAGDMLIDKQETIIEEVPTEEVPMAIPIIPATIVDKPNISLSKDIENNSSDYEKLNLHDLIESVDIAFRVLTEKLAPYVNIGDILLLKRLTGEEEVRSSELHFINTKHQGTYLRYVYDEGENYKLAATNRSPEFIIPKNKVKEIYFVVCRLTFALSMPDLLANKQLRQQSKQISSLVDSVNALVTATVNEGRRTDKVLEMLERQIEKKL